jgi:hypothetical protein
MNVHLQIPTNVWTAPNGTWFAGTNQSGLTKNEINSLSTAVNEGTEGSTTNYSDSAGTTAGETYVRDGTASSSSFNGTSLFTAESKNLFTPPTYTQFQPARTDGEEPDTTAVPATTATLTKNITLTTSNQTISVKTNVIKSEDTLAITNFTDSSRRTLGADTTNYSTVGGTTVSRTALAATTGIGSRQASLGASIITTAATQEGGWYLGGISTSESTYGTTTTGTPSTTETTRWVTEYTTSTLATSQTLSALTASVTYSEDITTVETTTVVIGTNTLTVGNATATITNHAFSPLEDTVCLMKGSRDGNNYNLGNQLWKFSLAGGVGVDGSTLGRFTNLFSSVSGATVTLNDFQKFASSSLAVTAITVSQNSAVTTTSTRTASTAATEETNITVSSTSKNGSPWNSSNASNIVTKTITVSRGDISTSSTSFAPSISQTHFYGSVQVTGYASSGFTSTTQSELFGSTSTTTTHDRLHSPASTTDAHTIRSSTTNETLISKFSSVGTRWQFVGLSQITTTKVFTVATTTTQSLWAAYLNPEIQNYTTSSTLTLSANNASSATNYSRSEIAALTYYTRRRVLPTIWSRTPDLTYVEWGDNAWYEGPPHGYAVGGNFTQLDMPIYLSLTMGLASGGAFETQTLRTSNLPLITAYPGVTFLAASPERKITPFFGARSISYVSRVADTGGTASVAVTWTSTTNSDTGTVTTSTGATYTIAGVSQIEGSFIRTEEISYNTLDPRANGEVSFSGGFGFGDNAIGRNYTVRIAKGFAEWTAYSSGSSISSNSISSTAGSVTFTIPASLAIVVNAEPIFSMSWDSAFGGNHYKSSTPYFPFDLLPYSP